MPNNLSEKEYRFGKEIYLNSCVEKGEAITLHPRKGYFSDVVETKYFAGSKVNFHSILWVVKHLEMPSTILVQFETVSVSLYIWLLEISCKQRTSLICSALL